MVCTGTQQPNLGQFFTVISSITDSRHRHLRDLLGVVSCSQAKQDPSYRGKQAQQKSAGNRVRGCGRGKGWKAARAKAERQQI